MNFIKVKIVDLCTHVTSGGTPLTSVSAYYNPKEIPWLKTGEVNYCRIYDTENYISKEGLARSSAKMIPANSVVVAMYGQGDTAGRVAINKIPLSTNQACCNLVINHEIADYEYVYYSLCTLYDHLVALKNGGAQPNLNATKIKAIEIPFPDLGVQQKIASVLGAYDDLIENNQKQIKLLEEAAQRLYKEWFVNLRFPGYEDTPIVDGVPEGWKKCSILDNDIFIFAKSKVAPFEGQKVYYATADVTGTQISGDGKWVTFQNKPSRAAIQPLNESIWFARMSNSYKILICYGDSSYLSETAIISSGFAGFTACKDCFGFVYATIASKGFDEEKNSYATGATQVSLTNKGLNKIQVVLPTIDLVERYSRIVEPYIEKAEQLKRGIWLLSQARDRLLPKLMSGEIEI